MCLSSLNLKLTQILSQLLKYLLKNLLQIKRKEGNIGSFWQFGADPSLGVLLAREKEKGGDSDGSV